MTQLPVSPKPPAEPAPTVSRQARERVLRMAASTLDLSSCTCWSHPIAELLVAARALAERSRSSRFERIDPSDLRDVEAWIAVVEEWLREGGR